MSTTADVKGAERARRYTKTAANGGVAPVAQHNRSTYRNWGCRCPECEADEYRKSTERRIQRAALTVANGGVAPTAIHNHSTYTNWGCRCLDCTEAWRLCCQEYRRKRRTGVAS